MKVKLLMCAILFIAATACTSPVKEHNKDIQHKANKFQNVQSGPLSGQKDTTGTHTPAETDSN